MVHGAFVKPAAVPGPSQQAWNTPLGPGLGPLQPWVTPCVCMTSTTNCASAASWAARANDNPVGIQSLSFYRASFCSKWWQRFKSSNQTLAPLQGRQGWQNSPKRPKRADAAQEGKNSTGFFLLQTWAPHLSRQKSQLLFSLEEFSYRKELRLNLSSVSSTKPPVSGGGSLGSATSWKAGREMKSLMVQLLQTQALMSCYHKHSRKGKRKWARITFWKSINLLLFFHLVLVKSTHPLITYR